MNKLLAVALLVVMTNTFGKGIPVQVEQTPIITPAIATGVMQIDTYRTYPHKNGLLFCGWAFNYDRDTARCSDAQGYNAWQYLPQIIPRGSSYVGFSIITPGTIAVYYK